MRYTLRFKLTFAICGVLLLAMALFAALTIQGLRTLLLTEKVNHTDSLSETLIRATHAQMLNNNRSLVYQIISDAQRQEGIERIRLVKKDGTIYFSTTASEIGTQLDKTAESCTMCHATKSPLVQASSMNRSRSFTGRDGTPLLGLAKAIYNEPACYTAPCHVHARDSKILGIIDIVVTLQPLHTSLLLYGQRFLLLTLGLLVLVAGALTIYTQRLVNRPVRKLLEHTQLVATGQLNTTVVQLADDELGDLARSFNQMTMSLQQARMELENWNHTLEIRVEERTEEISRMQAQLLRSEKLASLGELVAGIAHEINNPLTGILVYSGLVQNDPRLEPALLEDLVVIVRETERCAKIVRNLLDFSRASIPHKCWTSIQEIIEASLALVEHQSLFHKVSIIRDYDSALPEIYVDPHQLEQVIVNIVLNAGQAMPGGGNLTITTRPTADTYFATIAIADTGCGIPTEQLDKIFDPFFSTKANKGTGLGLSVSYGIINNHGGKIEVTSRVGEGTTFYLHLPLMHEVTGGADEHLTQEKVDPAA